MYAAFVKNFPLYVIYVMENISQKMPKIQDFHILFCIVIRVPKEWQLCSLFGK